MGYFAVNGNDATIALVFKGSIDGKTQRMRATITNVKAQDWHVVTISKANRKGMLLYQIIF